LRIAVESRASSARDFLYLPAALRPKLTHVRIIFLLMSMRSTNGKEDEDGRA